MGRRGVQRLATFFSVLRMPLQPPKDGIWHMRRSSIMLEPRHIGMSLILAALAEFDTYLIPKHAETIEQLRWPLLGDCHRWPKDVSHISLADRRGDEPRFRKHTTRGATSPTGRGEASPLLRRDPAFPRFDSAWC